MATPALTTLVPTAMAASTFKSYAMTLATALMMSACPLTVALSQKPTVMTTTPALWMNAISTVAAITPLSTVMMGTSAPLTLALL
jgi:hypothetical protein